MSAEENAGSEAIVEKSSADTGASVVSFGSRVGAAEPAEADPTSLRWRIIRARLACTIAERKWLSKLQEHDFSPWRTATALGMSKRTAHTFLRRERVRKVMDLMDELSTIELGLTRASVILRYVRLAEGSMADFRKPDGSMKAPTEWTAEEAALIQELSYDRHGQPKVKLYSRKEANDALAKLLKLFAPERVELTGKDGAPLQQPMMVVTREEAAAIDRKLDDEV